MSSNTKLPALPDPAIRMSNFDGEKIIDRQALWSEEQMHAYAEAAIIADREWQAGEAVAEGPALKAFWKAALGDNSKLANLAKKALAEAESGVKYMDEHTEAWHACAKTLEEVRPGFLLGKGSGIECAVRTIRELAAAPSPDGKAEQAEAPCVDEGCPHAGTKHGHTDPENWCATQPTASNAGERLTDDQVFNLMEKARIEFQRGQRGPRGQMLMPSDDPDYVLVRVVEAALASKPPAGEQKPVEWGSPTTVEKLIRQLQTFDPATPITSAVHTDYKGKRTALTMPLTMSRERVAGRFIRQGDESVPYSLVIWAQRDELAPQPEQVAQDKKGGAA